MPRVANRSLDLDSGRELLRDASRSAIKEFVHRHGGDPLAAIGYVFTLGGDHPSLMLCAELRSGSPRELPPDQRWNSGEYRFPAGLCFGDELGSEWNQLMMSNFHELEWGTQVVDRWSDWWLKQVSTNAMVDLAVEGTLGDWRTLDFNISSVDDTWTAVRRRHLLVRRLILERLAS